MTGTTDISPELTSDDYGALPSPRLQMPTFTGRVQTASVRLSQPRATLSGDYPRRGEGIVVQERHREMLKTTGQRLSDPEVSDLSTAAVSRRRCSAVHARDR